MAQREVPNSELKTGLKLRVTRTIRFFERELKFNLIKKGSLFSFKVFDSLLSFLKVRKENALRLVLMLTRFSSTLRSPNN